MVVQLAGALVSTEAEGGPFGLINGIPVHPLVVHAAVVMVPLTALGLCVMAVSPRFSKRYGWLVTAAAVVGAGASFVAKEAGEALAGLVGAPGFDHAELGDAMPIFAIGLLLATVVLWLIDRSTPADGPSSRRGLRMGVAVLAVLVALGNLVWIYRVGDSGAKSVWSEDVATAEGGGGADTSASGQAGPSPAPSPSTGAADAAVYSMSQVATHNTGSDCWAAIDGEVYNLTAWIDQHPGGPERILQICGTDGSSAYDGQHSGQQEPAQDLADFQIGTVGASS